MEELCEDDMSSVRLWRIEILEVISRINDLAYLQVDRRPFICKLKLQKALEGNGLAHQPQVAMRT